MLQTLTALVTAHLIADFVLQTQWLLARKRRHRFLLIHVGVVGLSAAAALGACSWPAATAVGLVTLTHLGIDYVKVHKLPDQLETFLLDQLAHLVVIVLVTFAYPNLAGAGGWAFMSGDMQAHFYAGMTIVSGLILAIIVGGIIIRMLIERMPAPPAGATPIAGMIRGGLYIGWLERALTIALVMSGKLEGVGFLLAAKSILRLGDITGDAQRHQAEYIIIGTFLSFGWALGVAMLTNQVLALWQ